MLDHFQCDVFLSHNQADKPRVRRLAERLRAAGGRAARLVPGRSPPAKENELKASVSQVRLST